jgi:DNA-binding transcriptional LysR family regulator
LPAQRGVTPTARAIELEAPVRRALDQVGDVLALGRGFDPATADLTVAIACSDYVQVAVIAPLALDLRTSAPKLRIAIRQLDGNLLGEQMEADVVDLAVMTPSTAPAPGASVGKEAGAHAVRGAPEGARDRTARCDQRDGGQDWQGPQDRAIPPTVLLQPAARGECTLLSVHPAPRSLTRFYQGSLAGQSCRRLPFLPLQEIREARCAEDVPPCAARRVHRRGPRQGRR